MGEALKNFIFYPEKLSYYYLDCETMKNIMLEKKILKELLKNTFIL